MQRVSDKDRPRQSFSIMDVLIDGKKEGDGNLQQEVPTLALLPESYGSGK